MMEKTVQVIQNQHVDEICSKGVPEVDGFAQKQRASRVTI
jgi:hypothetical protein